MKNTLKKIALFLKPLLMGVMMVFFDKKYISGRWFEEGLYGVLWGVQSIWQRNILRLGPPRPFPVALSCRISIPENIIFDPGDLNNFQSPGTYYQNFKGKIYIGKGAYIGPNVGLITANHDLNDLDAHEEGRDIVIGDSCWIGMNSVVLPGVILGPHTVVAAGAVVTKSYLDGFIVLAGVPAKPIKKIKI